MQTVILNNGVETPILAFGVFEIPENQTEQAVDEALAAGYRSSDTAAAYRNEPPGHVAGRLTRDEDRGRIRRPLRVDRR
jgi:diketogulonate reductase-like aldo/keto reductase